MQNLATVAPGIIAIDGIDHLVKELGYSHNGSGVRVYHLKDRVNLIPRAAVGSQYTAGDQIENGDAADAPFADTPEALAWLRVAFQGCECSDAPALGQAEMDGSSPVVIASDQSTIPVQEANSAGIRAAVEAMQEATPELGPATVANSTPVNIASDQALDLVAPLVAGQTIHTVEDANFGAFEAALQNWIDTNGAKRIVETITFFVPADPMPYKAVLRVI